MTWQEARAGFPDRWLIIDAIESRLEGVDVRLDEVAVLETTTEERKVMVNGNISYRLIRFSLCIRAKRCLHSKTIDTCHEHGIIFRARKE